MLLQMLLCVGQFFDSTAECEKQWAEFLDGKETGKRNPSPAVAVHQSVVVPEGVLSEEAQLYS